MFIRYCISCLLFTLENMLIQKAVSGKQKKTIIQKNLSEEKKNSLKKECIAWKWFKFRSAFFNFFLYYQTNKSIWLQFCNKRNSMALLIKQFFPIPLKDKLPFRKIFNYIKPWFFQYQAPNIVPNRFLPETQNRYHWYSPEKLIFLLEKPEDLPKN